MADSETVPENTGAVAAEENSAPVRKPRKPRAPRVPAEPVAVSADEKPKVPRTRKPRVTPAAVKEEVSTPTAEVVSEPTVVTPTPVEAVEGPAAVEASTLPERPVTPPTAPVEEPAEFVEAPVEPVAEDEKPAEEVKEEEEEKLTLESLFGPQEPDLEAEAKLAEEEAAADLAEEVYAGTTGKVLYATNGTIVAPGYWQAWAGKGGRVNVFAWLGVIFAFIFFPLGFLFSGLGFLNAKGVPDDKFSRRLSTIGVGISAFFTFIVVIPLLIKVVFGLVSLLWAPLSW
jgi:hypothetical protein